MAKLEFQTNDITIPTDTRNTVMKALGALGIRDGLKIFLNKQIPHEAGLGGGSANAATILEHVNQFFDLGFSNKELLLKAEEIGMDVPFFLYGGLCDVSGRGEFITKKEIKLPYKVILIKAKKVAFSTAVMYKNYQKYLDFDVNPDALEAFYENPSIETIIKLENNLERSIPEKNLIRDLKELHLKNGAFYSAMSGSGSSVFGLYENDKDFPEHDDYDIYHADFVHR